MRDLFMTARSFVKRLGALMRYRKALQDMNKYPDATQEELSREDTCIICREDMRPWNPDAGAIERSRPKKLPCGHILHFGCLKSWLERQQVCPTCRRSVVIDGAAANGDAAIPRMNGQPQAPGQPVPDNRPDNAGRPAQGGRGVANMRVWQFGPLRLGIAQGNPQNINLEEMAQRLRQPLDGANNPPAPAAPSNQVPLARDANINDTANNTGTNISDIRTQLQDIAQRIQQDMLAVQTSQHELQTLHAVTAELGRLHQLQQHQPPDSATQHSQINPQVPLAQHLPPHFAAPFPQPGFTQPGPMGINLQFPPATAFPHYPPRLNSPTIARYSGTPYTTAIPAGSADLPEGIVIPDGWSLLPLQRLDGQTTYVTQGAQQPGFPLDNPGLAQTVANPSGDVTMTVNTVSNNQPPSAEASRTHEDHTGAQQHDDHGVGPSTTSGGSIQATEPPAVAAPTPVIPNWGGAAQIFAGAANGAIPSSTTTTTSPHEREQEPQNHGRDGGPEDSGSDSSSTEEENDGRGSRHVYDDDDERQHQAEAEEATGASNSSNSKGKAKAATVEDAGADD